MPMDNTPGSITEPQAKFIRDLVAKKDLNGNVRYTPTEAQKNYLLAGDYSAMSKQQAHNAISKLLDLNDKPQELPEQKLPVGATDPDNEATPDPFEVVAELEATVDESPPVQVFLSDRELLNAKLTELEEKVDAGYYFIVNPELANGKAHDPNDGERFYHVSKPEPPSRWAGYTFIESRGGDFLYRVRDVKQRIAILEEIKKDPITAMNEYGIRLGVCGCCGRTLTAKDSRLRGLGPVCAARILGAPTQAQIDLIERLGLRK